MKKLLFALFTLMSIFPSVYAQRQMENLGRGLVASKVTNGVFVQWRITGQEWRGTTYNLYRDGTLVNSVPLAVSNYSDAAGTLTSTYQVAAVVDGVEQPKCAAKNVLPNAYIEIPMRTLPVSGYVLNDATAADLDGDGEMEIIIKRLYPDWSPSAQHFSYIEAYKLDGTFMWAINVGPNIFSDVETNVAAYDFDGDGKAEVFMRTSEGTTFADGTVITGTNGSVTNYRSYSWAGEDGTYPNHSTYLCAGPEFLSLINGETGVEITRTDYIPRGNTADWGDSYGHRANKFFFGAPYLDGKKPSLFIARGIYTRIVMKTFDVVGSGAAMQLVPRWTFDTNTAGNAAYAYQGNHNYNIADVDGDGRDEIVYGSMVVDDNGQGLYSTGLGHGDAIHTGDFDPYRKGLEVFACLESSPYYGTTLRAAESGQILLQYIKGSDCGRAIAANWSNTYAGAELAPGAGGGVWSASERRTISTTAGSQNFRIFWDGDLLEELVDHNMNNTLGKGEGRIDKWTGSTWQTLLTTTGYFSCNHTKGTPCLQADLFGDWREELIYHSDDESKLRIYFTTAPTTYRIYTLLHDMQYRQAICWQMCGYNQPPHVSFFLGEKEGITVPPPPVMDNGKMVYGAADFDWALSAGKDLLFDVSGNATNPIAVSSVVSSKTFTVNSPSDYEFNFTGGKISGSNIFVKQGAGTLTFNGTHDYSGKTELWDGTTRFSGTLQNSDVWLNLHAELEAAGTFGKSLTLEYGSILSTSGTLNIGADLVWKDNAVIAMNLGGVSDSILIGNQLQISDKPILRILSNGTLPDGDYVLMKAASLTGTVSNIMIEGIETQTVSLAFTDGKLILSVTSLRQAASVVWKGDKSGAVWDFANTQNFVYNGSDTYFAYGDTVVFDDSATAKTVNLTGELTAGHLLIDNTTDYVLQGSGKLIGASGLEKRGSGTLTLKTLNEYAGATVVNGGTLSVASLPSLTDASAIGFASSDANKFIINGGTLTFAVTSALKSQKALKIGANGATIDANAEITWDAIISGETLTKKGAKTLYLYSANTHKKLIIQAGTVALKSDAAVPATTTIVLEGGTLSCFDSNGTYSSAAYNIEVPEGKVGYIYLDSRCNYTGKLTGAGTFNVRTPWIRNYLEGNWSAFTGKINFSTDSDGGDCQFRNSYGLANAEVSFSGTNTDNLLNVYNESGATTLGSLTGNAYARLTGSHTWTVGAKNVNSTFAGIISNATGFTKVGTGMQIFTNANTYTGTTTIRSGSLLANNTTGSATGTGSVSVGTGGALGGKGFVGGNVSVLAEGLITPGDESQTLVTNRIGTLTLNKNLTLNGKLKMDARNTAGYPSDKLVVSGTATINGVLEVENITTGTDFPLGAELTLLALNGAVSGQFTSMILPTTEAGTIWDTSELLTTGKIKVVASNGLEEVLTGNAFNVYPNPASDYIVLDLPTTETFKIRIVDLLGKVLLTKTDCISGDKINVGALPKGVVIAQIQIGGKSAYKRMIIN
ncbi:MAG: autotransporter-associated beta strand repeat-containing protein [Candidatus Symbiothrix sp.]|jgi:autotransporter-associated beta strand protein|nr:autotransporter-associated beta strand repeat-containing protein [Candidatus Symbiothrix sp.]